jgi:hypothetical protein
MLASGLIAIAQETAAITGSVTDPTGAVIPNASVTVTNEGTNVSHSTVTNSSGLYRVEALIPGVYSVKAETKGFKTTVHQGIEITVGTVGRADLRLELGQETQRVTVEASVPMVNTEEGRLSDIVAGAQVVNLPLNGRNVFDLIKLAPGAVNVDSVMMEFGGNVVVNGVRETFNGFIMDGVANKGLSGGFVTQPNEDIVQEFQVNTLNMSAIYGNSAGSVTNLVTKSGTNQLHGDVYEFVRNDKFDATDFFTNESGGKKNPLRFNQFGGVIGGPIRKDKTFFFASFQGDRTITSAAPVPVTSESADFRNAVINALPNSTAALLYKNFPGPTGAVSSYVSTPAGTGYVDTVYGGFGTLVCPDNLAGFYGGTPTQNAPISSSFQSLFGVTAAEAVGCPTAIAAGQTTTQIANRALPLDVSTVAQFGTQTSGNLLNGNAWSARIDHNIGQNDRIFGRFYSQHTSDKFGPNNPDNMRGFKNSTTGDYPNLSLSWTHIFSPAVLNELKGGYLRNETNVGVPPGQAGVPFISMGTGEVAFGAYNGYPQFFHENIYTYSDMVSINHGKHNIKTGGDLRRNIENSEFNVARPSYYFFDSLFFAADTPAIQDAGVDPGIVSGKPAQLATNNRAWRNWEIGLFVQDDWKVSHNLTLNLGIRWDLYKRHVEEFGRMTQFILGSGKNITEQMRNANAPAGGPGCDTPEEIAEAQIAGICGTGGFAAAKSLGAGDHKDFGPRFGFAWDPRGDAKTALRGGFGVSYEGTLYNALSNSRWNLPYYSFNEADSFLVGGVSNVIYGPTARNSGGALVPSGAAPSYTGSPTNPGQGVGAQAVGNLSGWDSNNANLAFLTGVVDPSGFKDPYVYSFFSGVQRQVTNSLGLELNYVGSAGHDLFRSQSVNRSAGGRLPIPGTCAPSYSGASSDPTVCSNVTDLNPLGVANPNYGTLRFWENAVNSIYSSLQFSVTKKMSHGLAFNANYTWGHSIDGGSDWHSSATSANGGAAGDGYGLDIAHSNLDRGDSTFDFRHRFVFNHVWELPWMKSQTGFTGHVLGGWQFNGLWSLQSGAHWTPYDSRSRRLVCSTGGAADASCLAGGGAIQNLGGDYNLDGVNNDRPDVTGQNHYNANKNQYANGYFNGASPLAAGFFSLPCLACDGQMGRNTFVGPGLFEADLSLFKNIKMGERFTLQFRSEFFNAFNRANFKLPNSSPTGNQATKITSSIFGAANGTFDPREIQFALKLLF